MNHSPDLLRPAPDPASSAMPRRHFLNWSTPLLPALTDWLLDGPTGPGAPDLSPTVVIVPTAGAGRRLRESLAIRAGESGLLSPQVITPEMLISWSTPPGSPVAGRGESVTAWAAVLTELRLEEWRALFPIDPVSQDTAWAVQAAGNLLQLRRTLEEGARTLGMAARDLGPGHPELGRWEALARLEKLAAGRLESAGWRDSTSIRLDAARHPILPEGVTRVVLAGVPDSIRLVRLALEQLLEIKAAEIEVIIHAPESAAAAFDAWGRPLPGVWNEREIKLPKGNDSITLTARPEDAAHALVLALAKAATAPNTLAIGSADPEVSAPLRRHAAAAGIDVFDPEGLPLPEHEISWLLKTLTQLLRSGTWSAAGQLLRLPDVLASACQAARTSHHLKALEEWDAFQVERLPQNLSQAAPLAVHWAEALQERQQRHSESPENFQRPVLPDIIAWLRQEIAQLKNGPLPETLAAFLETLYGGRSFESAAGRQRFTDALTAWQDALESVERGAAAFLPDLSPADRLELAGSLLREKRLYAPHADAAIALHGWLELPWQDAPDLLIAGMNEGMVPDSLQGDAWLPDSVRALLDLKTNDTRLARDSYLLTTMIESRRSGGSIQLLAGRLTAAGDPLKPSRLLLRCPAADLPGRAVRLFPKETADESGRTPALPWHRAWMLNVPPPRPDSRIFQRLNVTAFGEYLKCPFRFYLKYVLKMEPVDASVAELDARTVGNLFHNTMEAFHQHPELRDSDNATRIAEFLHEAFEKQVEETYGTALTVPVVMQLDVIRNCLAKAAGIHAAESEKRWRFKEVEIAFPTLVRIRGTEIRGRIDLIQHHPEYGYRILDYKTSSTASKPADAHLKSVKNKASQESLLLGPCGGFATLDHGGKFHVWQNLQLPIYAKIMADHYDVKKVGVGYINLPRAVSEGGLEMWEDLDDTILQSAWACADGVVSNIQQGIFWPPGPKGKYDDFESLVFQDTESSFDPTALKRVQSMIASGEFHPLLSFPL